MEDFLKLAGNVVGAVAPTIASALGGPLAGTAVGAITSALGLAPDAPIAQVAAQVQGASPETLAALQKAENDFKAQMKSLDIDLERIQAGDRASARSMRVATGDWTTDILAFVVTIGFFGLLSFMFVHEPPAGSRDLLNIMLGALGGAWTTIIAFFYGSMRSPKPS